MSSYQFSLASRPVSIATVVVAANVVAALHQGSERLGDPKKGKGWVRGASRDERPEVNKYRRIYRGSEKFEKQTLHLYILLYTRFAPSFLCYVEILRVDLRWMDFTFLFVC